jgi:hypothetical protein
MSFEKRYDSDTAAVLFNPVGADNRLRCIIAALDENFWRKCPDQSRSIFGKADDIIITGKRANTMARSAKQ